MSRLVCVAVATVCTTNLNIVLVVVPVLKAFHFGFAVLVGLDALSLSTVD